MPAVPLTRLRLAACASLLCVTLTACTGGTESPGGSAGGSAGPSPVTATQSAAPSSSGATTGGIPATALLQASDVRGAKPEPLPEGDLPYVRPLRPCGNDPYPSDKSRTDAVAVKYFTEPATGSNDAPAVVTEFVGRHSAGGAAEQFKEINAALQRCPGTLGVNQKRWSIIGDDLAGDESILVSIDEKVSYAEEEAVTVSQFAALARVGDLIVVVADLGWENTNGSQKLVRELAVKAVERARTIG